jgi:hypothetical protein
MPARFLSLSAFSSMHWIEMAIFGSIPPIRVLFPDNPFIYDGPRRRKVHGVAGGHSFGIVRRDSGRPDRRYFV